MAAPLRNLFLALTGNTGTTAYTPSIATLRTGSLMEDCLCLILATDGNPTLSLSAQSITDGWQLITQVSDATNACRVAYLYYMVAADGVAPDPTINLSASESITGHGIRVRPTAAGKKIGRLAAVTATGSSTNPDPAAITNNVGVTCDFLFIAGWGGDGVTASTAAPTNYANHQSQTISNAANGCAVGTADRTVNALANAGTENPGTFTRATEQWAAVTLGLYQFDVVNVTASNLATGSPALGSPALTQTHAPTASNLAPASPALGTPALTQLHAITANNLASSAPAPGSPALTQKHALTANNLATSSPALGSPALTQGHALTASNLATGAPELGTPAVTSSSDTRVKVSWLSLEAYVVPAGNNIVQADPLITGAPELGEPALTQVHVLGANSLGVPTYGPELITNGTFDTNITGWGPTTGNVSDITWSAGKMRINANAGTDGQAIQYLGAIFEFGAHYRVTADVTRISGAHWLLRSGANDTSNIIAYLNYLSFAAAEAVNLDLWVNTYPPSETSGLIFLASVGTILEIDNVSVRKATESTLAPVLGSPALTQIHPLAANSLTTAAPVLASPVLTQTHALVANELTPAAPVLGSPTITQAQAIAANSLVTAAPALGSPALTQFQSLVANSLVTAAPALGSPALVQIHPLAANPLTTAAPVLDSPAVTQGHELAANSLATGAPELGQPILTQAAALTANSLATGAPELGTPTIVQAHVLAADSLATGAPELGTPAIAQAHPLTANNLATGAPELGTPDLSQTHDLTASNLATSAPVLASPIVQIVGNALNFIANSLTTAAPVLGSPVLTQAHAVVASPAVTGSPALGSPALTQFQSLIANSLTTGAPELGEPALTALHYLVASDLTTAAPELGEPVLSFVIWPTGGHRSTRAAPRRRVVAANTGNRHVAARA